jgi:hypothetical protein
MISQEHDDYYLRLLTEKEAKEKLLKLKEFIDSDPYSFCENCEAMKCYGSLYPICEPVLKKLKKILRE